jgi:RHS repeat-associated protein
MNRKSLLRRSHAGVATVCALFSLATSRDAAADPSMDDQRVSLPSGPGSVGGLGDNMSFASNYGLMTFSVPVSVPEGRDLLTPSVSFEYSSGAGNGIMGIGWNVPMPSIERTTHRGLPRYTTADRFAANGGDHLVFVGEAAGARTYRARYESGFVRYRWHSVGDGSGGYWTAENPDGTVDYFGADSAGAVVANARVSGPDGEVFRYHPVERVDPFGNKMRMSYTKVNGEALLDTISYAFSASGAPRYRVSFVYETRRDKITDATAGFEVPASQRLTDVRVYAGNEVVRRYGVEYETYEQSGGLSRVAGIQEYGRDNAKLPVKHTFGYTRALGTSCSGPGCEQPFVVDMGSLADGVDLATGRASLIDINADGLPDVVNTSADGAEHTFYLSELGPSGAPVFSGNATSSTASTSGFVLGTPGVQLLDVNGDGRTDMINARTASVLCNDGSGDWGGSDCLGDASLPLEDADAGDGSSNPTGVRFLDYDNDKRIDLVRTPNASETEIWVNTGDRFEPLSADPIGAVFDNDNLRLADINGDGLQDPVQILSSGELRTRINLGYGRWTEWRSLSLDGFDASSLLNADLEDINGDGLDDVVVISGNALKFALNRGGDGFDALVSLSDAEVDGDLPERTSTTTILFSDMNGNGTSDPIWVSSSGRVQFLELFPQRSNLMSRTENGLGHVQEVSYVSSVQLRNTDLESGRAWKYAMPNAVNVVAGVDSWVRTSGGENGEGLHEKRSFYYRDGYYDAVEKTFRGFAEREEWLEADAALDSQEPGLTRETYEVGVTDAYRFGLLVMTESFARGASGLEPIESATMTYADCEVAGVPSGTTPAVRHLCATAREVITQERAPEADWVTTRTEYAYDGYGRTVTTRELGVVKRGAPNGAACGAACEGDEYVVTTEWIAPQDSLGSWLLSSTSRRTVGEGAEIKEMRFYYDGEAFVGLPLGQQTRGLLTRAEERVTAGTPGEFVMPVRARHSADGNMVESILPRGSVANEKSFRKQFTYDADGLRLQRVDTLVENEDGPYVLRRDFLHDEATGQVSEATALMVVRDDEVVSPRNSTRYRYDAFGRLAATILPGDSPEAPSRVFSYELGPVATRYVVSGRTRVGGPLDLESIECTDGLGRTFQKRERLNEGRYDVSGFEVYNRLGEPVKQFNPYTSSSAECDLEPPQGVAATTFRYDALGRVLEEIPPSENGDVRGTRTVYAPLAKLIYDAEDDAAEGPFANTPTREEFDGLYRLVRTARTLAAGKELAITLAYNDLGRLIAVDNPAGDRHEQEYALRGEVIALHTLNGGSITQTFDENGDRVAMTDARGVTTRFEYDAVSRMTARFVDGDPSTRVDFTYDEAPDCEDCTNTAGKLVSSSYPLGLDGAMGLDHHGYDARQRPVYRSRTLEGHAFVTRYAYDNASRLVRTTFPDGQEVVRTFDAASRVTSIAGVLDGVDYNEQGLPSAFRYANGVITSLEYDAELRPTARRTKKGEVTLNGVRVTFGRENQIEREEDLTTTPAGRAPRASTFSYDALYRMTGARIEGAAGETAVDVTFDDRDNVLSMSHVGEFSYASDKPNAVTKAGDLDFEYDASGYMTRRGDRSYVRDHFGRITAVSSPDGTAAFAYGPEMNRVMKVENGETTYYINSEFEIRDGIASVTPSIASERMARMKTDALATTILSDMAAKGEARDGRIDSTDAWLAHASGAGLVEVEATEGAVSPVDRLLAAAARRTLYEATPDITYLHHDLRGSVTAATDPDGALTGVQSFLPTGGVLAASGFVDHYGFTGQELDASTGLLSFLARTLDPLTGRWTSPDPLFNQLTPELASEHGQSTTGYAYIANSFINGSDPTGLLWKISVQRHKRTLRWNVETSPFSSQSFTTSQLALHMVQKIPVVGKIIRLSREAVQKNRERTKAHPQYRALMKARNISILMSLLQGSVNLSAMLVGEEAENSGDPLLSDVANGLRLASTGLNPIVAAAQIVRSVMNKRLLNELVDKDLQSAADKKSAKEAAEKNAKEMSRPARLL